MKLIDNVEFPTEYPINQDCILFEDTNRVIFQLKHIMFGCPSTSKFYISDSAGMGDYYMLYRWDNTGGWKLILEKKYDTKEIAIEKLMILAKYFVQG